MCPLCDHDDLPRWARSAQSLAYRHRAVLAPAFALAVTLAGLAGGLFYLSAPGDIERAEADLHKAHAIVTCLHEEGIRAGEDARRHSRNAAEGRKAAADTDGSADPGYREYCESLAAANRQVSTAKWARRDALARLTAGYLRLLADAECEIDRAKDARDRGTPYKVAPRVRDLLAPILTTR